MEFHDLCACYSNTPEWHGRTFDEFFDKVQEVDWLKAHRDWVEANQWGMGDRPFHWMWKVIVGVMPPVFRFCEIGCYRGQVLSLIGLLAKHSDKFAFIHGVSPFAGTHDIENTYDSRLDYLADIRHIFEEFGVDPALFLPTQGYSQDKQVVEQVRNYAPFDIIYIDGAHEYDAVTQDIHNYAPMVRESGLLVVDDAAMLLNMPPFENNGRYNRCWPGLESVSKAVRDCLETRTDFAHRFAVGHNRVFQKTMSTPSSES